MKIALVDQPGWVGGQLYVENLARALQLLPEGERPSLVWLGPNRPSHTNVTVTERIVTASGVGRLGYAAIVARRAMRSGCDFVYPFPYRIPGIRSAFWLPDLQHRTLPQLFSRVNLLQRDIAYRAYATISPTVVLSSEAVKADFLNFFPFAEQKVEILRFHTPLEPGDVDEESQEAVKLLDSLPTRFVYIPNQMWQHKDHPTAIRAIAQIKNAANIAIPLLFSGERSDYRNPAWADRVNQLITELGVESLTRYLGHLPRKIQLGVMRRATVVVQPSLFEGWSTVVEDARALGKRMLLSDIAPNIEQAPPRGVYFSAGNAGDLATKLLDMWKDNDSDLSLPDLEREAAIRCLSEARTFMRLAAGKQH